MSKPSRRANRQGILELRKQKKKADKKLRQAQKGQSVKTTPGAAISNGKSRLKDVAQESQARQQAVSEQVRIFRNQLPVLLKRLSRIEDPRNAKKTKYQLTFRTRKIKLQDLCLILSIMRLTCLYCYK